jgi:aryl-phospho-beta-D-glucosidase BglC (GH1 family)
MGFLWSGSSISIVAISAGVVLWMVAEEQSMKSIEKRWGWEWRVVTVAVACLAMLAAAKAGAQDDLAFRRAAHLRRGINLSMWYAQAQDYSADRLASYTTAADFQLVHDLGFDHVRLSINPVPLIASVSADHKTTTLDPAAMARLDETVRQITSLGLVVVLDIHPETPWKHASTMTDEGTTEFFSFWTSFAQHYAGSDPEKVYFEVLNEPEGVNGFRWAGEQARAIALIRAQAPRQTIIATGEGWGGIDGLLQLEPVRDQNVIYSFHDYEPMEFTHQGASWSSKYLVTLRGVPYPSSPEKIAPLLAGLSDPTAVQPLTRYGDERWDAGVMAKRIDQAVEWAKQRHVPLWCGEFGAYRAYAPATDRAHWVGDMRRTLESNGIGWDMWDYQASFGLVTKQDGKTTIDAGIAQALGLKTLR